MLLFFCKKLLPAALCLPLLLGQAAAAEDKASEVPPASGAAQAGTLISGREALLLARIHLSEGRLDEAVRLYESIIAQSHSRDIRTEAMFQLAGFRVLQQEYRAAIRLYHEILNSQPNLPRVRLELARAYFFNKNYEDAQFQFELVRGSSLPPEVLEKVDQFLAQIRRVKDWNFSVDFGLVPDNNINQVSGDSRECIAVGGYLLCRKLDDKRDGVGAQFGATFNRYLTFSRNIGLVNTVSASALEYSQSDFDDYSVYLASGPRFVFDSGEISAQPLFRKRWYAGREYSAEYGLRLDTRWNWKRLVFYGGAIWAKMKYQYNNFDEYLDGHYLQSYIQGRYIINDRTFVQASLACRDEQTRIGTYSNSSWSYGIGFYRILPFGFSLFNELSLTQTRYDDNAWYITQDYRLGRAKRSDDIWQYRASLSSDLFKKYNLTPALNYSYLKRDSNIWTYSHDRHRINLSVSYTY